MTAMDARTYLCLQSDVWVVGVRKDAGLGPAEIKISDMTPDHRRRAAQWLVTKAQAFITLVECQVNEGLFQDDGTDTLLDLLSLVAQNPQAWMRSTTLFRALIADLPDEWVSDL